MQARWRKFIRIRLARQTLYLHLAPHCEACGKGSGRSQTPSGHAREVAGIRNLRGYHSSPCARLGKRHACVGHRPWQD